MPRKANKRFSSVKKSGFDTGKYLEAQSSEILNRVKRFDKRLYLEFGGKLCYDFHAARVLPGYEPDTKIKLFRKLSNNMQIIYCVSAKDIQRGKMRGDFGLPYDQQTLKDIRDLKDKGLNVSCVVITIYNGESLADRFKRYLENLGIKVYVFTEIKGYPDDLDLVVSDKGYGSQPYIKIEKPLVVVTGAGGGSGKMFLCLSQMYHDHKRGIKSGFSKFETFPIWNLPIDHPVNIAYEASTADLGDYNMVDPFHEKKYGTTAINYNRDIENFELMKNILERILGNEKIPYNSPTDMGVNKAKIGIINDKVCREAGKQEIIRRHFRYKEEMMLGIESKETVERAKEIMEKLGLKPERRKVVVPARKASEEARKKGKGNKGVFCGAAIELPNGRIVTGKNSPLLHASSAAVLNAIKVLADMPDNIHLIQPNVLQGIDKLKTKTLGMKSESLNLDETLIALSASSLANSKAEKAIGELVELKDCEMHITHIPTNGDMSGLRKIGLNVTSDAILTK
ncbi:MAG: DUF1846 family protein [Candidatus Aenigmarchaeota archaeon]|nr:DUF1846 family protein [Candidatus Aenigmarchaeota archaeon]NIP40132.1 DUF1846 family protein [Candidatus Aenigmarchaeota archaeon]NIQ18209.1 DUF1846 family protein [Candidatus Aenigmarchaeota archaeon]NIS72966.1 DUF1846 family protein [Candidatus Aenigmarchaeota archaeon]